MVGGAEDGVGREGQVVYPVAVGREGLEAVPASGVPYLDGFVLGACVEAVEAAPAEAGY